MTSTDHKLSISSMAWPASDNREALSAVAGLGFNGVEIVPTKMLGAPPFTLQSIAACRKLIHERELDIVAMQSIFHGLEGGHLFESDATREKLAENLGHIARLSGELGGIPCVFGAPRLRDPGALSSEQAFEIAALFFANVAEDFATAGACLCFEANTPNYGCRFVTTTTDAVKLVEAVGHPAFKLQFDTGTVITNSEPIDGLSKLVDQAAHAHISEPELAPVGSRGISSHDKIAASIKASNYSGWLSVEMRESANWRDRLELAWSTAQRYM